MYVCMYYVLTECECVYVHAWRVNGSQRAAFSLLARLGQGLSWFSAAVLLHASWLTRFWEALLSVSLFHLGVLGLHMCAVGCGSL